MERSPITGVVKDEAGAVVAGARITAVNPGASASFQAVANDTCIYTLRALPVGSYGVTAEFGTTYRYIKNFGI